MQFFFTSGYKPVRLRASFENAALEPHTEFGRISDRDRLFFEKFAPPFSEKQLRNGNTMPTPPAPDVFSLCHLQSFQLFGFASLNSLFHYMQDCPPYFPV